MATIIHSVAFENFYNYYGDFEQNRYDFTRGINIVNADNNMGKSKFYNGFLWLFNNQVVDSDTKNIVDADESLVKMASGKAKNEKKDFEVGFRVVFENEGVTYTIKKFANFRTINGTLEHDLSQLEVMKHENNADTPIMEKTQQRDIIDRVFIPLSLRPYSFLQGESLDRIVDLSSKKALLDTIDTLAGISDLKTTCDISNKMKKKAEDLFNEKETESSRNNNAKLTAITRREELQNRKYQLIDLIEKAEAEMAKAKAEKEELDAYISNSRKRDQIRTELERINNKITEKKTEIERLEASITSKIFDEENPWLLMNMEGELDIFKDKRERYIGDLAVQNNNGSVVIMLPEGSPDTSSLQRMLENERCEVCGQVAKRGSEAWEHIKTVLERPESTHTTRNDFKQLYGSLEKSASSYSLTIPRIDNKISTLKDSIDNMKDELDELINSKEDLFTQLTNAGGYVDPSEISKFDDTNIIQNYDNAITTIKEKESNIRDWNSQLTTISNSIDTLTQQINNFGVNAETEQYVKFKDLLAEIDLVFQETKELIFDRTIRQLEKEANIKYEQLTEGNMVSGGRLRFKKDHDVVNVSIRDVKNGVITGLGTGFQRMKQLAILMAVISSKIGNENKLDYPFISDAPFSEFGDNFIRNFFNVAPSVFTQCIILIKDLYDLEGKDNLNPLGHKVLNKMKEENIPGTFYVNIITEEADPTNLVTGHLQYK